MPVYLMIYPSADQVSEMRDIASHVSRSHGLTEVTPQNILHMTLGPLGPLDKVMRWGFSSWLDACEAAASQTIPFEIEMDRIVSSGSHMLLMKKGGNEALRGFRQRLLVEMMKQRCKFDSRYAFQPHVTVLHHGGKISCELEHPVRWQADGFRMVLSIVGESRHETIAQWNFDPTGMMAD